MELYGFMEREKKIPSYFFIITKKGGHYVSTFLIYNLFHLYKNSIKCVLKDI